MILTLRRGDFQRDSRCQQWFAWKPGDWHHLARTWRARRLEVYVDGQRVGVSDHALLARQIATTFRVGDRPWHVPRTRQTLLDEIRLYDAPLDAVSIASAAPGEPACYQPQMSLE